MRLIPWTVAAAILLPVATFAQQPPQPAPQPPPAQPQPTPAQPQPAPVQPSNEWEKLPRMQLERQFAGPLKDTVIQRWRDPNDGAICYVYLPISVAHSQAVGPGFVQYGSNTIGTLSCYAAPSAPPAPRPPAQKK